MKGLFFYLLKLLLSVLGDSGIADSRYYTEQETFSTE
jgi:hypothetical protein